MRNAAATSGRVLLDGKDMTGKPLHVTSRMEIVRSFQQTNTFRAASVRENISRAVRFSGGGTDAWNAIVPLLDEFGLAPQLEEQSDKLPYGLQKMLGLILAYVREYFLDAFSQDKIYPLKVCVYKREK